MVRPGDIISYNAMCIQEGVSLQRGMNYRITANGSIILMSLRKNAPYADKIEDDGRILIYEGHDAPKNLSRNPKLVDQPRYTPRGSLTQNGKFETAALKYKNGAQDAELVKVYEKIRSGIWVYNGIFKLVDSWLESSNNRKVFKFKLVVTDFTANQMDKQKKERTIYLDHNRFIPTSVKLEVWKRDKGVCVQCGSPNNLHFDHILPFSKGGTSLRSDNIQLLCARHNLQKSNNII